MVAIRVRVAGLNEFIAKTDSAIAALERGDLTEEIRKKTERRAKYRAPRKKGTLVRATRAIRTGKDSFTLLCDVENKYGDKYAGYLEDGTRFIKIGTAKSPRVIKSPYGKGSGKTAHLPFLSWALWRTLTEADKIFKDKILKYYK